MVPDPFHIRINPISNIFHPRKVNLSALRWRIFGTALPPLLYKIVFFTKNLYFCNAGVDQRRDNERAFSINHRHQRRPEPPARRIGDLHIELPPGKHAQVQQEVTDEVEDLYLRMVLTKSQGRVNRAAQFAGLNPRGLYNKMKRLGLNEEDFKKKTG
jgi:hypothetical protein